MTAVDATPAMAQYLAAKRAHPDALVFFRLGDFYELFYEDAKTAAKALNITLTSRQKGENPIPMAGVPVRAVDGYLRRLVRLGFKVAICEQMQDPKDAKGVVDRQVIRVVTPGTLTEDNLLEEKKKNLLLGLCVRDGHAGLAWVELSTGEFCVQELREDKVLDEVDRLDPAEILLAEDQPALQERLQPLGKALTRRAGYDFGRDTSERALCKHFGVRTLEGFGVAELPLATGAAGALLAYLQETQLHALPHLRRLEVFQRGRVMVLDRATRSSLELVHTLREGDGTPLLAVLDQTATPMGGRLLRDHLLAPLCAVPAILARQQTVAELFAEPTLLATLRTELGTILDLERLTARIATGRAHGRDLLGLGQSLRPLARVRAGLAASQGEALRALGAALDPLEDLARCVAERLADDPPAQLKEGGLIRPGFDPELDELRTIARDSKAWIARFQAQEIARTGIPSLKVSFNQVFGYYIEVTHAHQHVELPKEYVRKQTTKNAERYITDELKVFETKVLRSEELGIAREYALFCALRDELAGHSARLLATARQVAELDVACSHAHVAKERRYCRPLVDDSRVLEIEDGRHPVLEATHAAGTFVPNDTRLDPPQRRIVLLTGPNMAGKSTFIRQNALLVVLAQIGAFVPAKRARIGVVDRVFTRVGAADDISRGASTFMVEMVETANILNNATARSLVILDEVGRGTSTYDGLSLAWAIAEDLHDRIGCRALFATHYHQLCDLAGPGKGVVNLRVAVKEWGEDVVFLHRIEEGGTDKSYGLHVAKIAGIPPGVLARARSVLARIEEEGEHVSEALQAATQDRPQPKQQKLFVTPRDKVLQELGRTNPEELTPLQALQQLAEWVKALRGAGGAS